MISRGHKESRGNAALKPLKAERVSKVKADWTGN
jgi:hypothetical protein